MYPSCVTCQMAFINFFKLKIYEFHKWIHEDKEKKKKRIALLHLNPPYKYAIRALQKGSKCRPALDKETKAIVLRGGAWLAGPCRHHGYPSLWTTVDEMRWLWRKVGKEAGVMGGWCYRIKGTGVGFGVTDRRAWGVRESDLWGGDLCRYGWGVCVYMCVCKCACLVCEHVVRVSVPGFARGLWDKDTKRCTQNKLYNRWLWTQQDKSEKLKIHTPPPPAIWKQNWIITFTRPKERITVGLVNFGATQCHDHRSWFSDACSCFDKDVTLFIQPRYLD